MKRILFVLTLVGLMISASVSAQNKNVKYPQKVGNLRFKTNYLVFMNVYNTEAKTDTFRIYNDWDKPMELSITRVPAHVTYEIQPKTLKPQSEGMIIVTFDAAKQNNWGYTYSRFTLVTNDSLQPSKQMNVSANVVEDFTKLSPKDKENAPKVVFKTTKYQFGTVTTGDKVTFDFEFSNEGKTDLIIRKVRASCGCTSTKPDKMVLKPGESSKVGIVFNTAGRKGRQHKNVTFICNDPTNPVTVLMIEGTAEAKQ